MRVFFFVCFGTTAHTQRTKVKMTHPSLAHIRNHTFPQANVSTAQHHTDGSGDVNACLAVIG